MRKESRLRVKSRPVLGNGGNEVVAKKTHRKIHNIISMTQFSNLLRFARLNVGTQK